MSDKPLDLECGGAVLNYDFRDALFASKIDYTIGEIDRYTENGVILEDGSELQADLIVFATGYKKSYHYFDQPT